MDINRVASDEPSCEYCLERIHDIEKKIAELKKEIEYYELIIYRRLYNEYPQLSTPAVHATVEEIDDDL